ncbi:MAG: choice-of-anchor tandem repeat GloVer-containing protein [Candidatus Korobacteraceae bacterium]
MAIQGQSAASLLDVNLTAGSAALVLLVLIATTAVPAAQAQTFQVLHTFTGGADGSEPSGGGLTSDSQGNLYGTAANGGIYNANCLTSGQQFGCGTVYKLTHKSGGWAFSLLYSFTGSTDGYLPNQILTFDSEGSLYGSTRGGGGYYCQGIYCGTVFKLRPPAAFHCITISCPWTETTLYQFQGYPNDGAQPAFGHLTFDAAGNLYGTTSWGAPSGYSGNVYKLTPGGSGWTESVLYNFTGGYDGDASRSGVVFDNAGNLYGTTTLGGLYGDGVIFRLTPTESGWRETVLHNFQDSTDGSGPNGAVVMDAAGNLYGVTFSGGPNKGGTVWELSPSNGSWTFRVPYALTGSGEDGPNGGLFMDAAGNLYGATLLEGAYHKGNVFKLSPSNGAWVYTSLYDFTGGSDGSWPNSRVTMDANGNLFGSTELGGEKQNGVIWEITP